MTLPALLAALCAATALASEPPVAAPPHAPTPTPEAQAAPSEPAPVVDPRVEAKAARRAKAKATLKSVGAQFKPYGFLKPTVSVSSAAVESFGRPNQTAITAAANPVLASVPDDPAFSFQVGQSRIGLRIAEAQQGRAQIELDFVDFDKSTPTVASLPRIRIAEVSWDPAKDHTITAGQGWDLFGSLMPHGFNLVGANFQAGNVGFMRQQVQWRYHPKHADIGVAIGMPGANTGPAENALEHSVLPTFAVRLGAVIDEHATLRAHGFATLLRPDADHTMLVWAASIDGQISLSSGTDLRFEATIGQNTANTGMLTLAQGRADVDVRDAGGWISVRQPIGAHVTPYLTAGGAGVLHPDDVVPSYTSATDTAPAARNAAAGPGIRYNVGGRVGAEVAVAPGLAIVAEGFAFATRHQLADAAIDGRRTAGGFEGGMLYRF
jgi:hypothetical protein